MAEDHLEPLITECPNCSTRFRVTENQLQVATGKVRCGACLTVFQGIDHLVWESGPGFESAEAAKHALDELLNELSFDDLQQPSASVDKEPSATNEEPSATNKEPSATNKEPSATNKEPSASGEEPAAPLISESNMGEPSPDPLEAWDAQTAQVFVGHESDDAHDARPAGEMAEAAVAPEADDQVMAAVGTTDAAAASIQLKADPTPSNESQPAIAEPEQQSDAKDPPNELESGSAEQPQAVRLQAASGTAPVDPLGLDQIGDEVSFAPEPRRWGVGIAMGLGVLALLGQVFWYQFESWGRDPTLRPVYGLVCDFVGCELPVLRELRAMQTQKLLVRSHPELADALIVDAVIVNDAAFAQPFPVLELRFTTINGTLVARRGFKPEEYLAGELAGVTLMEPKTPVRLALEITDPGGDAVNYFLSFR